MNNCYLINLISVSTLPVALETQSLLSILCDAGDSGLFVVCRPAAFIYSRNQKSDLCEYIAIL